MKKFLVLFVALSAFLTIDVYALDTLQIGENLPCSTDSPWVPWEGPELLTLEDPNCPGCFYIIEYWYREVAAANKQIQVTNIYIMLQEQDVLLVNLRKSYFKKH